MYDLIIIGSGPAGLTSAIYGARANLKTLIIEKSIPGGQISWTDDIENYPGFEKISGMELANKMTEQAKKQGAELKLGEVLSIEDKGEKKIVKTSEGDFKTKSVILAVGSNPRKLSVKGEKEFEGKGIHYCALCDGAMYKDKKVAVIGGGDAAIKEAIYLSNIASKVFVIHRRNELRAEKRHQQIAFEKNNIEFVWNSEVKEFVGTKFLEKLKLINNKTNKESELEVSASFTYIGHIPATKFVNVEKNEKGYIKVNEKMQTNVKGIFACGDCIQGALAQIATSVGSGAIAATSTSEYMEESK